jgi:hypothetical protein
MKPRDLLSNALTVLVTLAISFPLAAQDHRSQRYKVINLGTLGGRLSLAQGCDDRPRHSRRTQQQRFVSR